MKAKASTACPRCGSGTFLRERAVGLLARQDELVCLACGYSVSPGMPLTVLLSRQLQAARRRYDDLKARMPSEQRRELHRHLIAAGDAIAWAADTPTKDGDYMVLVGTAEAEIAAADRSLIRAERVEVCRETVQSRF